MHGQIQGNHEWLELWQQLYNTTHMVYFNEYSIKMFSYKCCRLEFCILSYKLTTFVYKVVLIPSSCNVWCILDPTQFKIRFSWQLLKQTSVLNFIKIISFFSLMKNADILTKYLQFVFTLCKGHKPVITSVHYLKGPFSTFSGETCR